LSLLTIWSVVFSRIFTRPFEWDDLHFIRSYSFSELASTFYGPNDPDQVETPALRPIATLLFHLQGTLFGENMILQRAFMIILMGALLSSAGLLLREVGLTFYHVALVLVLFVSGRIFASLVLWITLGSLILAYIFMTLAALFYIKWTKQGVNYLLALCYIFSALAVFTREEAYTLPVALPLIWWLATLDRANYKRPFEGALGILLIVAAHYVLRTIFIHGAPGLGLHSLRAWKAVLSAWFPGGAFTIGWSDQLLELAWFGFLVVVGALFIRHADRKRQELVFGSCMLGLILSTPHLGVLRSFGTALPAFAFFSAISIATVDVATRYSRGQRLSPQAMIVLSLCFLGLALGLVAGIRRSIFVAQALHQNEVHIAIANGKHIFDLNGRETVPEVRRKAVMAHLRTLGIYSRDDIKRLMQRDDSGTLETVVPPMFIGKYKYQSW
jgi:hypothetical protein